MDRGDKTKKRVEIVRGFFGGREKPMFFLVVTEIVLRRTKRIASSRFSTLWQGCWHNTQVSKMIPVVIKYIKRRAVDPFREEEMFSAIYATHEKDTFFPSVRLFLRLQTDAFSILVMEPCETDLFSFFRNGLEELDFRHRSHLCFQLCRAVFETHRRKIAHGDISPENFMRRKNIHGKTEWVLIDWAEAQYFANVNDPTQPHECDGHEFGKSGYCCPEMSEKKLFCMSENDVFGLLVTLCVVMTGTAPWYIGNKGTKEQLTERKVQKQLFREGTSVFHLKGDLFASFLQLAQTKKWVDWEVMEHEFLQSWRTY